MRPAHTATAGSAKPATTSIASDPIATTYCILAARSSLTNGSMRGKNKR